MSRREFPKSVKVAAWERCGGHCEECDKQIANGAEYDHDREDYFDGSNTLENCRVLCIKCHKRKTKQRRPAVDKTRRILEKQAGLRSKRPFPQRVDPWGRK